MTIRSIGLCAAIVALTLSLATGITSAGTTGSLVGTVTDLQHVPIAGASVVASSPAQRQATISDATGHFSFVSLAPGAYVVTVAREGYTTQTYANVFVNADVSTAIALQTFRPLRQIGSLIDFHYPSIVQDRVTSDVYVVTPVTPFYSFDGHDIYALHFIPGLIFGSAPVLSR